MKKKSNQEIFFGVRERKKILLTMKIVLCFILFSILNVSGSIFSQNIEFSLEIDGKTVKEVFKDIENQSGYRFLYNDDFAGLNQLVSFNTQGRNIGEVLDELLVHANLTYRELDNELIVITPKVVDNQQYVISGIVRDASTGEPIPGVSVVIAGTTIGTTTNIDGEYRITVPETAEFLQFSFIGMTSQNVAIDDQTVINVDLTEDRIGLDELIVIGYGTQTRANVIGSVTSVRSDDLTTAPVSRVSNALAGRLPGGIFLQEGGGEPGRDSPMIRVRGNSTLNNNNPLIVIDGIPDRDLNSLNPADIESVTVLKDASAAIYGARAANGVILVTTNRGQAETPARFTYSFYEGWLSPTKLPKMTDSPTYASMIREREIAMGIPEGTRQFSQEDIEKYKSGEYWWTHPNTDWFAEALKDYAKSRSHNLSVSGGTQNVRYFSSFGTQMDDGIFTNGMTKYNRYNMRANIDFDVNEYLTLGLDVVGVQENGMYPTRSTNETFVTAIRLWPTSHAVWPNGLPGPDRERGDQPMVSASDATGFDDDKRFRSNNIFSARLEVPGVEGLSLSSYYAYDLYMRNRKLFETPWYVYHFDRDSYLNDGNTGKEDGLDYLNRVQVRHPEPRLTQYSTKSVTSTFNFLVDYTKSWDSGHNLSSFVSYEHSEYDTESFEAYRRFFISDQLPYLFAGGDSEKDNTSSVGLDARQNYFGRLAYNFRETYLFQFSFRRDGSLRFSKEHGRWGNFPSVLVGWRPSEEPWWRDNFGFIEYFKLRASFGKMGNDLVDPFQYLTSYGFSQGYSFGEGKVYTDGLNQANVPNPFITWEVANVYNAGWESMFLDNRLSWETDFFFERRSDILVTRDVSVPQFTGISLPDENFGIVENRGFETIIGWRERSGDFHYNISGNFAFAKNKIVEYDEPARSVEWQQFTGHPIGSMLLYNYIGVFRDMEHVNSYPHVQGARPGDLIIEDFDGDGKITTDDRIIFDRTSMPQMTFGLSFGLEYKNWSMSGLLQGQSRTLRNMRQEQQGIAGNFFQYDADGRWTPDNPDASKPRSFERYEEYWRNTFETNYYWVDASYLRLRNLNIAYNIPREVIRGIGLSEAKLYVAGQNLFLLHSGNPYVDPELEAVNRYPLMRNISLGAQISF